MLTPILLTLLGIAIIIVISTCMSWFHSTEVLPSSRSFFDVKTA